MYDFNYQRASSLDDAKSKFSGADDARYMAGGMTLLPVLKQRLDQPSDVVDLGFLDDLKGISEDGGNLVIKAMTVHHAVNTSDLVKSKIPALAHLAGTIGDPMARATEATATRMTTATSNMPPQANSIRLSINSISIVKFEVRCPV